MTIQRINDCGLIILPLPPSYCHYRHSGCHLLLLESPQQTHTQFCLLLACSPFPITHSHVTAHPLFKGSSMPTFHKINPKVHAWSPLPCHALSSIATVSGPGPRPALPFRGPLPSAPSSTSPVHSPRTQSSAASSADLPTFPSCWQPSSSLPRLQIPRLKVHILSPCQPSCNHTVSEVWSVLICGH